MLKKTILAGGLCIFLVGCVAGGDDSSGDQSSGDGDSGGDGDLLSGGSSGGDGDLPGDGDAPGDGDGGGDGDVPGDGDGDDFACLTAEFPALRVQVIGGATEQLGGIPAPGTGGTPGVPVFEPCNATVTAVDGEFEEELDCSTSDLDCWCQGAEERAGTYTVTARLGDDVEEQVVTVTSGPCGVKTESLTFFSPVDQAN